MAGLFVLLFLFLLVAVMFIHYRYKRKNKQTRVLRKDLLLGYAFLKGSPWKSSSSTKGTGKNPLKVVGASRDNDALKKIFRPPTDEGGEKKDIGAIVVEDDNPTDEDVEKKELEKIVPPPTSEGIEKKDIGTIVVEDDSTADEDVEKKEVVATIIEDDNSTDEDVEKDVGRKMTYTEFQKLLLQADSLSTSCAPRKSEYGRGYQMGILIHFNEGQPGSLPDYHTIAEIARRNGCRIVHAFARGYSDGCMGLQPEYTG